MNAALRFENPDAQKPLGKDPFVPYPASTESVHS